MTINYIEQIFSFNNDDQPNDMKAVLTHVLNAITFHIEYENRNKINTNNTTLLKSSEYSSTQENVISLSLFDDISATGGTVCRKQIIRISQSIYLVCENVESKVNCKYASTFRYENKAYAFNMRIFQDNRIVLRINNVGMKFIPICSVSENGQENCNIVVETGPLSDPWKQTDTLGDSIYVSLSGKNIGKKHDRIYVLILDHVDRISHWHVIQNDEFSYYIEAPDKKCRYLVKSCGEAINICSDYDQTRITTIKRQ